MRRDQMVCGESGRSDLNSGRGWNSGGIRFGRTPALLSVLDAERERRQRNLV